VAKTIYEAATDGTTQLRYIIGADAHFFIDKKAQAEDQDFVNQIREYFIYNF